jgi:hypothetical protein
MQVIYERCCGLDVHKKTVVACVVITSVLATCGIRRPGLACENTSTCFLLLADSSQEEYNLKHASAHLYKGERTPCRGYLRSSPG